MTTLHKLYKGHFLFLFMKKIKTSQITGYHIKHYPKVVKSLVEKTNLGSIKNLEEIGHLIPYLEKNRHFKELGKIYENFNSLENALISYYQAQDYESIARIELELGLYDDASINLQKTGYNKETIDAMIERLNGREGQALKIEVEYLKKLEKQKEWFRASKVARNLGLEKRANRNIQKNRN